MQRTASTAATRVEPLAAREEWEAFVHAAPDATFFHRSGWRDVLEQAFGFRSHFLVARRHGNLVGVLPLCELRPFLGAPRLLSLPFAVQAGISATDDDARRALEAAAVALARDIGARSLELRDGRDGADFQVQRETYCSFQRSLSPRDEENLARIPRKQRRMIRIGQGSGLCARVETHADTFYELFAHSQRRLGTPLLPRRYFTLLLHHFAADSVILTIRRDETPVAAVFSFLFRDRILPYYAGSRQEYFRYGVNDFMYWELMRFASRRGFATFDFGRSRPGSGAFDYKRHWGFTPEPLCYRIHPLGHGTPRKRTLDDTPVRLLRWGWRRLPLSLTKQFGPYFARHFAPYFT